MNKRKKTNEQTNKTKTNKLINQGSHFPAVSRISAKMKFQNPQKKKKIREKKSGPIYF